jgi:hypothetical protein
MRVLPRTVFEEQEQFNCLVNVTYDLTGNGILRPEDFGTSKLVSKLRNFSFDLKLRH